MNQRRSDSPDAGSLGQDRVEVSVVIPCLNEEDTLGACIAKAFQAFRERSLSGEVIVADNGSDDSSVAVAERMGARVVHVPERGYGAALMGGIDAARGKFVIMGDADDSYDFCEIPRFVDKLREGYCLVQGCRLPAGGGRVMPGAMPFLHRWVGNPLLSRLVRFLFRAPIHDVYCGLRGFTKDAYRDLNQRCTGMEFANEMIVKSTLFGKRIAEIPITLHVDGRRAHAPHLRTFRDGWRTLRFLLMCSPRWLFLNPGLTCLLLGIAGFALTLSGVTILGGHTLLFSSLAILVGHQAVVFAIVSKTFAVSAKMLPEDPKLNRFLSVFTLERGILFGGLAMLVGLGFLMVPVWRWWQVAFGELIYEQNLPWVVPGVTLVALGFQSMLASFLLAIVQITRR